MKDDTAGAYIAKAATIADSLNRIQNQFGRDDEKDQVGTTYGLTATLMEQLLGGPDKPIGMSFCNMVQYRTHSPPRQYKFTTQSKAA